MTFEVQQRGPHSRRKDTKRAQDSPCSTAQVAEHQCVPELARKVCVWGGGGTQCSQPPKTAGWVRGRVVGDDTRATLATAPATHWLPLLATLKVQSHGVVSPAGQTEAAAPPVAILGGVCGSLSETLIVAVLGVGGWTPSQWRETDATVGRTTATGERSGGARGCGDGELLPSTATPGGAPNEWRALGGGLG